MTRPARWKLTLIACGLALLAAGCGSGGGAASGGTPSSTAAPSTTASQAASPPESVLCADAAALRASLDKLTHVKVGAGTVDEIKADLKDVQTSLTAFVTDARGQWQAQTSSLDAALANLKTAIDNLAAKPSASAVASVAGALGDVNTAAQHLLAAVNTRCPSASPSPSA